MTIKPHKLWIAVVLFLGNARVSKCLVALLAAWLGVGQACYAEDAGLLQRLHEITAKYGTHEAPQAERELLTLLQEFRSPTDRGLIYAKIAFVFANSGILEPGYAEKVIEYCSEAARYPLVVTKAGLLHVYWGEALGVVANRVTPEKRPLLIREAMLRLLEGMSLVLANQKPRKEWDVKIGHAMDDPRFREHALDTDAEAVQKVLATIEAEIAARIAERRLQETLVNVRTALIQASALLCRESAEAVAALRELAPKMIKDRSAVKEILRSAGLDDDYRDEKPVTSPIPTVKPGSSATTPMTHQPVAGSEATVPWTLLGVVVGCVVLVVAAVLVYWRSKQ